MTKATNEFRRCINEAKELHARQIDRIQRERDAALLAARVHGDVDDPNNINQIQGVDMPASKKVITNWIFFLCFRVCPPYKSVPQLQLIIDHFETFVW